MTYFDYKQYMKKHDLTVSLVRKGKPVDILEKVKPVRPCHKIGYLELLLGGNF